jgi:hypothetical protein
MSATGASVQMPLCLPGLCPVHRLNARENAAASEKPTKYAVSFTETFFVLRTRSATAAEI